MNTSELDKYLNRLRDEFHYSVYKCESCNLRAFGSLVSHHELKTGHKMIKETSPNED